MGAGKRESSYQTRFANNRQRLHSGKSLDRAKSPPSATARPVQSTTESTKTGSHSVKVEYASILGSERYTRTLITKWVDYSTKYGIGYKLSNGCYGVLFNDSTKMMLNQNCFNFCYVR